MSGGENRVSQTIQSLSDILRNSAKTESTNRLSRRGNAIFGHVPEHPEGQIWKSTDLCVVELVDNGRKVLDYLSKNDVDILLLDIQMPILSGLEVMETIFLKYPMVKSIIFSGHADFKYAQQAISYGVTEHMLKPINISHICDVSVKSKKIWMLKEGA
ncbi:CheY-like chemotaxis protein [Paenibacillus eucommiae]|uniref:CheY-like chemotaxis protein n=1 Tax=Paenibacillus eucommiae TaxID=1355755 RepID=A0ABS4JB37_9BACL|nr:CheY-like chemotaxis protein [Paenibacillus eucommiae]